MVGLRHHYLLDAVVDHGFDSLLSDLVQLSLELAFEILQQFVVAVDRFELFQREFGPLKHALHCFLVQFYVIGLEQLLQL